MIAHVASKEGMILEELEVEPADMAFVRSHKKLGATIRWFCRGKHEPPTYTNHTAGVNCSGMVVEALWTVKRTPWAAWEAQEPAFELWRCRMLPWADRYDIAVEADKYVGRKYGWWKIGLHLGDALLTKAMGREVYLFRQIGFMDKYPICSWVWAYAYDTVGYRFGCAPDCADPDGMHDFVSSSWAWKMIYKKG